MGYQRKLSVMTCKECGARFLRTVGSSTKYCSEGCKPIHMRSWWKPTMTILLCECCGEPFTPKTSHTVNRYCSPGCRNTFRSRELFKKSTEYRLNLRMRQGIRRAIGRKKGGRSWEDFVEFDRNDLKEHLERQFTKGMTWEKFKAGDIHIDHIVPLSSFDFENEIDDGFKRAWALTNLRPMWAIENMAKGAEIQHLI